MKLRLQTSGGFANLRLEGELDLDELPTELSERIEHGLASEALREAAAASNPALADGTVYELTILPEDESDERHHYVFDDAAVEDELFDILDAILQEIIRRRRQETRTARQAAPDARRADN